MQSFDTERMDRYLAELAEDTRRYLSWHEAFQALVRDAEKESRLAQAWLEQRDVVRGIETELL